MIIPVLLKGSIERTAKMWRTKAGGIISILFITSENQYTSGHSD